MVKKVKEPKRAQKKVDSTGIARVVLLPTFSVSRKNSARREDLSPSKLASVASHAQESPSMQLSWQNIMEFPIFTRSRFFTISKIGTR